MTGAVAPERLAPVCGSAEGILVAYIVFGQPIVFICIRVKGDGSVSVIKVNERLTAEVAPTAA